MKKIQVLMSTYNGERYLMEQLNSILEQEGKIDIKILVRDDGSTDNTIRILKEFEKKGKLRWYSGKNLGPAKSFIDLIKNSDEADFYAFSDQDDYWEKNKLITAINHISKTKIKTGRIYYSALNLVNENLEFKKKTVFNEKIDFKKGIVRNQATGCTMVFDNYVRNFINNFNFDYVGMHDSLLYRLALTFDWYIFRDDNSYIKYRQHSNNVLGMSYNRLNDYKKKIKRFFSDEPEASLIAEELLRLPNISKEKIEYLNILSTYKRSIKNKIKLLFMKDYKCNSFVGNMVMKIKILFNRL